MNGALHRHAVQAMNGPEFKLELPLEPPSAEGFPVSRQLGLRDHPMNASLLPMNIRRARPLRQGAVR